MSEWIKIRGPARVSRCDDGSQVTAREVLAPLDGAKPDLYGDLLSDYLEDDERSALRISGGVITLRVRNGALLVETEYRTEVRLSDDQCLKVLHYTAGQWADGFGDCADGLGPRGTAVAIWDTDATYELETSWLPEVRRVTWTLMEDPSPHRVAAFAP